MQWSTPSNDHLFHHQRTPQGSETVSNTTLKINKISHSGNYIALVSASVQTRCVLVICDWMSDCRITHQCFWISTEVVYLQHCLAVMIKGKVFLKEGCFCAPSTAFRHLPPNSARIGYPTEGALFISVQLSTIASALRKVWVLITLWKQLCPSMHINMRCVHPRERKIKSSISIQMIVVLCWC